MCEGATGASNVRQGLFKKVLRRCDRRRGSTGREGATGASKARQMWKIRRVLKPEGATGASKLRQAL